MNKEQYELKLDDLDTEESPKAETPTKFRQFLNKKRRALLRFLTHPRNGVVLALIALGIGVGFFLAAPLLLPAAAPALAAITLIGLSWATISLLPYFIRFINGLRIDKQAMDIGKDKQKGNFLGVLIARAIEWRTNHPYQLLAVFIGVVGLAITLSLTITFFTGGVGALVIPAILAPLGLAPAIPLLLFNLLPLALANIVKGIMAETTSNGLEPDTTLLAWKRIHKSIEGEEYSKQNGPNLNLDDINLLDSLDQDGERPLAIMLAKVDVNTPTSQQVGAALFWGKPKLHNDPLEDSADEFGNHLNDDPYQQL